MGFLNNWISGCAHTQGLGEAVTIMVAKWLNLALSTFVTMINALLHYTVLSQTGDKTISSTVHSIILSLDGMAVALLVVLLVWSVLSSGEELMTKGRWDGLQGLVGRAGSALLWIVGAGIAVPLLIGVNNQIVSALPLATIVHAKQFANTCPTATGNAAANEFMGIAAGAGASLAFLFLGVQGVFLLLVIAVIYVFWQWLSRLAEILFWGSLLPLAAATLVADSSRQMFNYVWRNVQGAIFTQAAMALGIYIIESAVLYTSKTGGGGAHFLNMLVSVAGFFLVGKIPQYFKEMHGHSTSGGFDAAKGAAAIIMARGASAALGATPGGQFLERTVQNTQAASDQRLGRSRVLGGMWHKMGQNIARGQAVKNFDQARYETTPGVTDLNYNAEAMRETHYAAWQKDQDQNDRWGPDDYAPGTQGGFDPSGPGGGRGGAPSGGRGRSGGGGRPGGFMPGGGGFTAGGPRPGPSGSAGGGMPPGTVTVENFNSAAGAWEAGPVMAAGAIPLGQGPDPAAFASQMPAVSHAVGDPLATRGNQQVAGQPNLSADAFVQRNADKMRNYLRHVVQPNTIAATAFQPAEQVAKMAELQQHYRTLGWAGPEATATFAKLYNVSVEQLNDPKIREHIAQDLAVKQWGGNLRADDDATIKLKHPLSNTGVQAIQTDEITRNFAASPREASRYLKGFADRKAAQAAVQAREAGWRS